MQVGYIQIKTRVIGAITKRDTEKTQTDHP